MLFSWSVVSNSLWPYRLQHSMLPCYSPSHQLISVQSLSHAQLFETLWTEAWQAFCPSPIPRACSNSCPSSWWCHPTILSSVVPFSSCLQSFPMSGSFEWVGSLHQVAKVLEFQLQHHSLQRNPRADLLQNGLEDLILRILKKDRKNTFKNAIILHSWRNVMEKSSF